MDAKMLEEQERALWEAKMAIAHALTLVGREMLIDYLPEATRKILFDGYVLKEHYDCLARKYDIATMSNNLVPQVVQEAW